MGDRAIATTLSLSFYCTQRLDEFDEDKKHNNNNNDDEHTLHSYYDLYLNLTFVWDKNLLLLLLQRPFELLLFRIDRRFLLFVVSLCVYMCAFLHFQFS